MIICSIVIIINSVFTLQVLTAKLPNDCGPCEIKAVFIHTRFASYRSLRLVAWGARTPKWPIKKGRESEHHFWGFPQVILFWSDSVPNNINEAIIIANSMNVKNIASKSLGRNLFKIIELLIFNPMNLLKSIA
jgi:hypothetical protein